MSLPLSISRVMKMRRSKQPGVCRMETKLSGDLRLQRRNAYNVPPDG